MKYFRLSYTQEVIIYAAGDSFDDASAFAESLLEGTEGKDYKRISAAEVTREAFVERRDKHRVARRALAQDRDNHHPLTED